MSREPAKSAVGRELPHDSALRHVTGEAQYVDDLPEPRGLLHAFIRLSERAHARVTRLDVAPAAASRGVAAVLTARDLARGNDIGPVFPGEPVFADGVVDYAGQSLFAVAAETMALAREAAARAVVEYEDLPAILTAGEASRRRSFVLPTHVHPPRATSEAALARAPHRLSGELRIGGQEHFYLETQAAWADAAARTARCSCCSSTQHPSEVQAVVAHVLDVPRNKVTVRGRRAWAAASAARRRRQRAGRRSPRSRAQRTGRPVQRAARPRPGHGAHRQAPPVLRAVRGRLRRRGPAAAALELELVSDGGWSLDLSRVDQRPRAVPRSTTRYYVPTSRSSPGRVAKTNVVSNTAFRGFGGPQGMLGDGGDPGPRSRAGSAADPRMVRERNLYAARGERTSRHYGQEVERRPRRRASGAALEQSAAATRERRAEIARVQRRRARTSSAASRSRR